MGQSAGDKRRSDWRVLLGLGEELLSRDTTTEQCALVIRHIEDRFPLKVSAWMMGDLYPLPGEPDVEIYLESSVPLEAIKAAETRQVYRNNEHNPNSIIRLGLPLLANNTLLGVVYAESVEGILFEPADQEFLEGLAAHAAVAMENARQGAIKRWRYEQLALVRQVSDQIANVGDLDELCRRVTSLILNTFRYYYVAIFTIEDGREELCFRANAGKTGTIQDIPSFQVRLGEAMIGYTAQSGLELVANDVRGEPRYEKVAILPETRAEFCLPIKVEDSVLGVLDVQSDILNDFHEIDMLVLRSLTDSIGLAIAGIRMYSRLQARAEELSAVFEFSRALNSILDPEELLNTLTQLIHERFGFPHVYVFTVHSGRRKVIFGTGSGARSTAYRESDLQYDLDDPMGMIPQVARSGKTILANDVSLEPYYRPSDLPPNTTCSELTVPLIFGENILGVLDIQSDRLNGFNASDVSRFEALAASIAISMRNALLYRSEKWRLQVAESMRDVAVLVSSNMEVPALLDTILTRLEQTLPCEASAVWLVEPGEARSGNRGSRLYLAAVHGITPDRVRVMRKERDSAWNCLDEALRADLPLIRRSGDPYDPLGSALQFPQDYSSISAPMHSGEDPLGVITLVHSTPWRYGAETSTITATYASYASVAIQNARLFKLSQEQARKATILLEVGDALRSVETEPELLDTLVEVTTTLMGIKQCAVFLWEQRYQVFISNAATGLDGFRDDEDYNPGDNPALARLLSTRQPVIIQNFLVDIKLTGTGFEPGDGLAVLFPVLVRGNLLGGVLAVYQPKEGYEDENPLEEETLTIIQGIVHQAALALENLRLEEAKKQEAYVTAALLQVAQAVVSQNELVDILKTIVDLLPDLVGIDTCIIYMWSKTTRVYQPVQVFAGSKDSEDEIMSQSFSSGVFDLLDMICESKQIYSCLQEECSDSLSNWMRLECGVGIHPDKRQKSECRTWLMGYPLTVKGEALGVMLVKENQNNLVPHEKRLEILQGVSQQVALAFQNEAYNQDLVERERTEREFQLARQIQQNFLPDQVPHVAGWDLDVYWETARQVGGDLYDIFPLGEGRLGLVIADVSDKGMPAALYMTVTHSLIRAHAMEISTPATLLERVNYFLLSESQNGMFVTAVYAILDTLNGKLVYANAGHNMPLLLKGRSGIVEPLPRGGMAMGVIEEYTLENFELTLEVYDTLLFYTDGVSETFSPDNEMFGETRLEGMLAGMNRKPVAEILNKIDDELAAFRNGNTLTDDITMVGVRRLEQKDL